jgi:hypothetical protein
LADDPETRPRAHQAASDFARISANGSRGLASPVTVATCTGLCPLLTTYMTALIVGLIVLMALCLIGSATVMALVAVYAGSIVTCQG